MYVAMRGAPRRGNESECGVPSSGTRTQTAAPPAQGARGNTLRETAASIHGGPAPTIAEADGPASCVSPNTAPSLVFSAPSPSPVATSTNALQESARVDDCHCELKSIAEHAKEA